MNPETMKWDLLPVLSFWTQVALELAKMVTCYHFVQLMAGRPRKVTMAS